MELPVKDQTLLPIPEIIKRARERGFIFGFGDPYNRVRYYIKIGLLTNMVRRSANGGPTEGHLPSWSVDRLIEIQKLKHEGHDNTQILEKLTVRDKISQLEAAKMTLGDGQITNFSGGAGSRFAGQISNLFPKTKKAFALAILTILAVAAGTFAAMSPVTSERLLRTLRHVPLSLVQIPGNILNRLDPKLATRLNLPFDRRGIADVNDVLEYVSSERCKPPSIFERIFGLRSESCNLGLKTKYKILSPVTQADHAKSADEAQHAQEAENSKKIQNTPLFDNFGNLALSTTKMFIGGLENFGKTILTGVTVFKDTVYFSDQKDRPSGSPSEGRSFIKPTGEARLDRLSLNADLDIKKAIHNSETSEVEISDALKLTGRRLFNPLSDIAIDDDLEVLGNLRVKGSTTSGNLMPLSSDLYDIGSAQVEWNRIYGKNATITDTIALGGTQTRAYNAVSNIGGTPSFSDINANNDLYVQGSLEVGAAAYFGSIGGTGTILPTTDNTFDLGSSAVRWRDLYLGPTSLNISDTTGVSGAGSDYVNSTLGFSGEQLQLLTSLQGVQATGGDILIRSAFPSGGGLSSPAIKIATSTNLGAADTLLQLSDSAADFLTVTGGGNVGIGTTAPAATFDLVSGTSAGTVQNITANSLTTGTGLNISSTGIITGAGTLATITGNAATTGTLVRISGTSLTSGSALDVTAGTTTGNAVAVTSNGLTTGTGLNISSTGTITGAGNLVALTANSLTSGTLLNLSGTGLTSGTAFRVTGPSGATSGVTAALNELSSDIGASGKILSLSPTFDNAVGTGYGLYINGTDSTAAAYNLAYLNTSDTTGTTSDYFIRAQTGGATDRFFVNTQGTLYASGNVGIGVTSPFNKLDVSGAAVIGSGYAQAATAPTNGLLVQGNVGIGTTAPNNTFQVVNLINFNNGNSGTFVGYQAGNSNTGTNNAFYGYQTGYTNTGGGSNAAFGYQSLYSNSGGNYNVALGSGALYSETGNNNTALGYQAGYSNAGASGNVFLGYQAGYNEIGSNRLYIANTSTASPLLWGDFSTATLGVNGNVGIGTTSPKNKLDISGSAAFGSLPTIALPQANMLYVSGNVGIGTTAPTQALDVIGAGQFSTNLTLGGDLAVNGGDLTTTATAFNLLNSTATNITFGGGATSLTIGAATGTARIMNATVGLIGNVGVGTSNPLNRLDVNGAAAIGSLPTTVLPQSNMLYVSGNVGIGTTSPGTNLDVVGNINASSTYRLGGTAVGNIVLQSSGAESIFVGTFQNGTGTGTMNTFLGSIAGAANPSGGSNTFLGRAAGFGDTTGSNNTFVGRNAGLTNTTGSNNTTIGYLAEVGSNNLSNATAVGANAVVGTSNSLVLGGTGANAVNVGIGTTGPDSKLTMVGAAAGVTAFSIYDNELGTGAGFQIRYDDATGATYLDNRYDNAAGDIYIRTKTAGTAVNGLFIESDGNVGIGTTGPGAKLEVYHTTAGEIARFTNTGASGFIDFYEGVTARGYIGYGDGGSIFTGASTDSLAIRAQGDLHLGGTGDNLAMTIKSGNVGIGTTGPAGKLHITTGAGQVVFGEPASGFAGLGFTSSALSLTNYSLLGDGTNTFVSRPTNGTLNFREGNTTQMIINSGGNVGIGPNPLSTSRLVVQGSGATSATSTLNVTNNSSTSLFFINDAGNVGIGTTAPSQKLDIFGNVAISNSGTLTIGGLTYTFPGSQSANALLLTDGSGTLNWSSSTGTGIQGYWNRLGTTLIPTTATDSLANLGNLGIGTTNINPNSRVTLQGLGTGTGFSLLTRDSTGAEKFAILDNGNVGIGTTKPSFALVVKKSSPTVNVVNTATTGYSQLRLGNTLDDGVFQILVNATGENSFGGPNSTLFYSGADAPMSFATNTSEKVRITSSGNVGIGTTAPSGKLDITDTSNTAASLSLTNNTATTIGVGIDTLGVLDLQSTSLTTGNFLNLEVNALTSGKGLNLTSTSTALTGDLANITASGSNAAVTGNVLKVGLTGALATGTALNVTTAGALGFALRVNDDGTYTDTTPFVVDYTGNVGIGTTGPVGKLDVKDGTLWLTDSNQTQPLSGAFPAAAYGSLSPLSATKGGLYIMGISDTDATALAFQGYMGSNDPTDTTPAMEFYVSKYINSSSATQLGDSETAFQFWNRTFRLVTIKGSGNVGIGTTNPLFKLDVNGTANIAGALTTTGNIVPNADIQYDLGTSALRWKTLHLGPASLVVHNDATDTLKATLGFTGNRASLLTDASTALWLTTGANQGVFVGTNGNVGVGTTSPSANLHVIGQCVTGDTILRRRRKKSKVKSQKSKITGDGPDPDGLRGLDPQSPGGVIGSNPIDDFEDVRIDQIKPGDEIQSMEPDGTFSPRKVRGVLDMGRQETYKLITHTGKKIRTTAQHPYFVLEKRPELEWKELYGAFEVDQSNRLEDMGKDSAVSLVSTKPGYPAQVTVTITKETKLAIKKGYYSTKPKLFGPEMLGHLIIYALWITGLRVGKLIIDKEYTSYEMYISRFFDKRYPEITISFRSIGHEAKAHKAAWAALKRQKAPVKSALAKTLANLDFKESLAAELLFPGMPTGDSQSTWLLPQKWYQNPLSLSSEKISKAKWVPAQYLRKGALIATVDGWETITAIYKTGTKEKTYDVEIAGTHNFVGNGIVAHNTYLQGSGTTTGFSLLTKDSTGADKFAVLDNGNVGIGTTGPSEKLNIYSGAGVDSAIKMSSDNAGVNNILKVVSSSATPGLQIQTGGGTSMMTFYNAVSSVVIPSGRLQVTGETLSINTGAGIEIGNPSGIGILLSYNHDTSAYRDMRYNALTHRFENSSVEAMRITAGNVGIGTTAPSQKLDIFGNVAISNSGTLTIGGLTYTFPGSQSANALLLTNGSGSLSWSSATGGGIQGYWNRFNSTLVPTTNTDTIGTLGNIGIGTTSPLNKLDVSGSVAIGSLPTTALPQSNMLYVSGNVGIGTTGPNYPLSLGSSIGNKLAVYEFGGAFYGFGIASGRMYISTTLNSDAVTFTSEGNVGIGTSTPQNKLDVYGSVAISNPTTIPLPQSNMLYVSGNVGIGTTAPNSFKLELAGSIGPSADDTYDLGSNVRRWQDIYLGPATMHIGTSTSDEGTLTYDTGNNTLQLNAGAATPSFVINSSGNVGIGTTGPGTFGSVGAKLEVQHATNHAVLAINAAAAAKVARLALSANGQAWLIDNRGTFDSPNNRLAIYNASPTEVFTISSSGNVGIGTVSPQNKLDVNGSVGIGTTYPSWTPQSNMLYVSGNVGIGTTNPLFKLDVNGTANIAGALTTTGNISPNTDNQYDLGATNLRWKTLHVGPGSVVVHNDATNTLKATLGFTGNLASLLTDASTALWLSTGANNGLFVTTGGNVGVGTTSPATGANLHVIGQCVTGDTILRRRRKKSKVKNQKSKVTGGGPDPEGLRGLDPQSPNGVIGSNPINPTDEWEDIMIKDIQAGDDAAPQGETLWDDFEDVRIDQIQEGDEIQTLDEVTGQLVTSKVKALMDMGTKEIFRITTKTGKTIRTTGNHPYFTLDKEAINSKKLKAGIFVDDANLYHAAKKAGFRVDLNKLRGVLGETYEIAFTNYHLAIPNQKDKNFEKTMNFIRNLPKDVTLKTKPLKYIWDSENQKTITKGDVDLEIALGVINSLKDLDVIIILSGDSDYVELRNQVISSGKKIIFASYKESLSWEIKLGKHLILNEMREEVELKEQKTSARGGGLLLSLLYQGQALMSSPRSWEKVSGLKEGDLIAVTGRGHRAVWDKITKIEKLLPEPVFDIEVEGTHNFVAGHYVNKRTRSVIPSVVEESLVNTSDSDTRSEILRRASLAQDDIEYGGIVAHNTYLRGSDTSNLSFALRAADSSSNDLFVVANSGNVGIGTTGPAQKLDVQGSIVVGNNSQVMFPGSAGALSSIRAVGTSDLTFRINGTDRAIIDASGNVGIGTITPRDKLNVTGAVGIGTTWPAALPQSNMLYVSGNVGIGTTGPTSGYGAISPILEIEGSTNPALVIHNTGQANTYTLVADGDDLSFYYGSSLLMGLQNDGNIGIGTRTPGTAGLAVMNGNVGIGTTAPGAQLQVQGDVRLGYGIAQNADHTLSLGSGGAAQIVTNYAGGDGPTTLNIKGWGWGGTGAFTSGVYINGSGNVGIGTTGPRNKLDVSGSVAFGSLPTQALPQSNSAYFSGNVGIGTTGPGTKLEVAGVGTFSGLKTGWTKTVVVDASGKGDYTTIASAITGLAGNGGRIYILPGTYTEDFTSPSNVFIEGTGSDQVTIQNASTGGVVINGTAAHVKFVPVVYGGSYWQENIYVARAENSNIASQNNNYAKASVAVNSTVSGVPIRTDGYCYSCTGSLVTNTAGMGTYISSQFTSVEHTNTGSVTFRNSVINTLTLTGGLWGTVSVYESSIGTATIGQTNNSAPSNTFVAYRSQITTLNVPADAGVSNIIRLVDTTVGNTSFAASAVAVNVQDTSLGTITGTPNVTLYASGTGSDIRVATRPDLVPFIARGTTSQTANLFQVQNSTPTTLFLVDASGNVGIGTTAPVQALDVVGVANVSTGFRIGNAATSGNFLRGNGTNFVSSAIQSTDVNGFISGNTNFLSKFTGANSLGNSLIFDNGTILGTTANTGIGTTNPLNKLDVSGSVAFGSLPTTALPQSNSAYFSGNVGIGTTLPGARLQLRDTTSVTSFTGTGLGVVNVMGGANNGDYAALTFGVSSNPIAKIATLSNSFGSYLAFGTSNNYASGITNVAMSIDHGGNVGIGTTGPEQKLHVVAGNTNYKFADSALYVDRGASGSTWAPLFSKSGTDKGGLKYDSTNDNIEVFAGGIAAGNRIMSFTSTGNVGIGTTGPHTTLTVANGGTLPSASSASVATFMKAGTAGTSAVVSIVSGNAGNSYLNFGDTDNIGIGSVIYDHVNNRLGLGTNGTENRLVVDSGGNVGIGTTSPTTGYKMEISSAQTGLKLTSTTGTNYALMNIANTSGSLYAGIERSTGDGLVTGDIPYAGIIAHTGNYPLQFATNNSVKMTILSGGNVGIGTTSPGSLLHIAGSAPTITLDGTNAVDAYVQVAGGSQENLYLGVPTGALIIENASGGADYMTVNGTAANITGVLQVAGSGNSYITGNVGIGTVSPNSKLTVAGDVDFMSDRLFVGTSGNVGIGISAPSMNSRFTIKGAGTGSNLSFLTTDSSNTQRFAILDNGNVGIGTTGPAGNLHVKGTIITEPSLTHNASSIALFDNGAQLAITRGSAAPYAFALQGRDSVLDGTSYPLVLNPLGGNVGIGTTSPSSKLEVAGTATQLKLAYDASNYETFTVLSNGNLNIARNGAAATLALTDVGVGIGTTSPGKLLTINSDSGVSVPTFRINSADTDVGNGQTIGAFEFYSNDASTYGTGLGAYINAIDRGTNNGQDVGLEFGTRSAGEGSANARTKVIIDFAGNVGIGTTGPGANLHIKRLNSGSGSYSEILRLNAQAAQNNNYADMATYIGLYDAVEGGTYEAEGARISWKRDGGTWGGTSTASTDLAFWTKPVSGSVTERLTIKSTGNVGIGTVSPGSKLSVVGGVSIGSAAVSPTNGLIVNGNVGIGTSSPSYLLDVAGASWLRGSSTGPGLFVDTSGNVGIGTTSPGDLLTVSRNVANSTGGITIDNAITSGYSGALNFKVNVSGATPVSYTAGRIEVQNTNTDGGGFIAFSTPTAGAMTTLSEAMRIKQGNVGIGTVSPNSKLTVAGDVDFMSDRLFVGTSGNVGIGISAPSMNSRFTIKGAGTGTGISFLTTDSSNTQRFAILDNGNVGIGTTLPGARLQLRDTTSVTSFTGTGLGVVNVMGGANNGDYAALTFGVSSNPIAKIATLSNSFGSYLAFGTSNNYASGITNVAMSIDHGGNVGIGTTGPNFPLVVKKAVTTGAYLGAFTNSNTEGLYVVHNGSNNAYFGAGANAIVLSADYETGGSYRNLAFATNNLARMVIDTTGNVGIGTTAPGYRLDVNNRAILVGADHAGTLNNTGRTDATNKSGYFVVPHYTNAEEPIVPVFGLSSAAATTAYIGGGSSLANAATQISFFTAANNTTVTGTEVVRIDSTGNVGIGTVSPGSKLSVIGDVNFVSDRLFVGTNGNVGIGTSTPGTKFGVKGATILGNTEAWVQSPVSSGTDLAIQGNVGIGTTAPRAKLEIIKDSTYNTEGTEGLSITDGASDVKISIGTDATNNIGYISSYDPATSYATRPLVLQPNNGNVGIGTTSPLGRLHVSGGTIVLDNAQDLRWLDSGGAAKQAMVVDGSDNMIFNLASTAPNAATSVFKFNKGSTNYATIQNGNVGIGTTNPAHKIDVVGTAGLSTGTLWTNTSDARIKTNIETISDALTTVSQLNPVQFKYTSEYLAAHPEIQNVEHYGFIAQDFQKVFPNSVSATGPNGLLQLNASNVIPYAIKAVQELSSTQTTFNDRLTNLESGIRNQESRITTALDELSSLKASVATESSQLNNLTTEITALKNIQEGLISKLADIELAADWASNEITFKKPVSLEGSLTLEQAASVELIGLDPKIGSNPLTNADLGITSVSDLDSAEVIGSNPITPGTEARGLDPINPAGAPKTAESFSLASLPETAAVTQKFTALDPTIEAGDVVALQSIAELRGSNPITQGAEARGLDPLGDGDLSYNVVKSTTSGDEKILGVVGSGRLRSSSTPGVDVLDSRSLPSGVEESRKVILLGKASVKVTAANGAIRSGDFLRTSSTPGFAEKASDAGMVIGRALEDYPNETHKSYEADEPHKISVLVNVSWYDPSTSSGQVPGAALSSQQKLGSMDSGSEAGMTINTGARGLDPLSSLETLTVTGSTSLADLTVAGNVLISANLNLTDEGVSAVTGDLSLQKFGQGKVNLFNGKAVFTPDGSLALKGTLTADKIVANTVSVGKVLVATTSAELVPGRPGLPEGQAFEETTASASASTNYQLPTTNYPPKADPTIGSAILPAGDTMVEIANNQITANSKVFITPTSPTGGQPLIVSEKTPGVCPAGATPTPGVGCTGGFTVEIEQATRANISFDYWVIN